MRSAGHWYGGKLARDLIIELERGMPADQVQQLLEAAIADRAAALRTLGADDDKVEAWIGAFSKCFFSKVESHERRHYSVV
jgi:hypothetical protein